MAKEVKENKFNIRRLNTIISLLIIFTGMLLWYPSITGNVVAGASSKFVEGGAALFVLGVLGAFLANRK